MYTSLSEKRSIFFIREAWREREEREREGERERRERERRERERREREERGGKEREMHTYTIQYTASKHTFHESAYILTWAMYITTTNTGSSSSFFSSSVAYTNEYNAVQTNKDTNSAGTLSIYALIHTHVRKLVCVCCAM